MREVFTPDVYARMGVLLAESQKRVRRVDGRRYHVADICARLRMSTATFYDLREAK